MQFELTLIEDHNNSLTVPVCTPVFTIGRAKDCHLRSSSIHVSRRHCVLFVHDDTITIQDLGGENGTCVNGRRISDRLKLKDGDKIKIGTHIFVISFKQTEQYHSKALSPDLEQTQLAGPESETPEKEIAVNPVVPIKESELIFEIQCAGESMPVTKSRLFRMAQRGAIKPDDEIIVCGTQIAANSIQGIVFGQ